MYTEIQRIYAREIPDSHGNPTVEVVVTLGGGAFGRAAIPSGAITCVHESHDIRDGDKSRYGGKGLTTIVEHVNNEIAIAINGMDALDQGAVDRTMLKLDGTLHKDWLGSNTTMSVSLAVAQAAANSSNLPLFHYLGGACSR